jgi:anti-sigma regulatory factor (Ser/Thr protein kinase)
VVAAIGTEPAGRGLDAVLGAALCKQAYLAAPIDRHHDLLDLLTPVLDECERYGGWDAAPPGWLLLRLSSGERESAAVCLGDFMLAHYCAERAEWRLVDWQPAGEVRVEAVRRWSEPMRPGDMLVACSRGLVSTASGTGSMDSDRLLSILWDTDGSPDDIARELAAAAARQAGGAPRMRGDATCLVAGRTAGVVGGKDGEAVLEVERRMDELLRVRAFCRDLARPVLCEEDSARLVLAADETMSNIVRHAGREDLPVEMRGNRAEGRVQVEFRYQGPAFQPSDAPELPDASDPYPEGGYGLYIIHRSADQVEYSRDGGVNRVCLTVAARPTSD